MSDTLAQHGGSRVKAAVVAAASKVMKVASAIPLPCSRRTKLTATTRRAGDVHYHSQTGRRKAQCTLFILGLGQIAIGMSPMDVLLITCLVDGVMAQSKQITNNPIHINSEDKPTPLQIEGEAIALKYWLRVDLENSAASAAFATELSNGQKIIITNYHAILNANDDSIAQLLRITSCRRTPQNYASCKQSYARTIAADATVDLAALEIVTSESTERTTLDTALVPIQPIESWLSPLAIATDSPSNGEQIACFGPDKANPAVGPTLRLGIITSSTPEIVLKRHPIPAIRSNVPGASGTSGSACINHTGKVIGIRFAGSVDYPWETASKKPYNFEISISAINLFLKHVEQQIVEKSCWAQEAFFDIKQATIQAQVTEDIKRLNQIITDSYEKASLTESQRKKIRRDAQKKIDSRNLYLQKRCPLPPAETFYDEDSD